MSNSPKAGSFLYSVIMPKLTCNQNILKWHLGHWDIWRFCRSFSFDLFIRWGNYQEKPFIFLCAYISLMICVFKPFNIKSHSLHCNHFKQIFSWIFPFSNTWCVYISLVVNAEIGTWPAFNLEASQLFSWQLSVPLYKTKLSTWHLSIVMDANENIHWFPYGCHAKTCFVIFMITYWVW